MLPAILNRVVFRLFQCSSASRKFLNRWRRSCSRAGRCVSVLFSEPKIPQLGRDYERRRRCRGFSALQRAENSSIHLRAPPAPARSRFSALQRAENSSITAGRSQICTRRWVSVLFSEPKIPQFRAGRGSAGLNNEFQCSSASRKFLNPPPQPPAVRCTDVSVLFSEPKIPQCAGWNKRCSVQRRFQCSSASRKFLN